ncbi:hypothetical protein AX774_g6851 [Zancudomyces culisetae]|uniref:Uncharacterized protein n=1 Tax=Zancudomyces culisetae TaxID=1213189 RepID=A0A1R1PFF1_ZANCU|nr:hypothetical protein AX774_g6851 [Zancudomyces culisetae]|eukprot:OMH79730.1 hypothetical protein AX774_g6851 [Zancudomyces culisetae]
MRGDTSFLLGTPSPAPIAQFTHPPSHPFASLFASTSWNLSSAIFLYAEFAVAVTNSGIHLSFVDITDNLGNTSPTENALFALSIIFVANCPA